MTKKRKLNLKEQDQVQKLKADNIRLKRENKRLQHEIRTFKKAFNKTIDFVDGELQHLDVDGVIDAVSRGQKLGELVNKQRKEDKEIKKEKALRDKWECWDCGRGFLKLVIFNRRDGVYYYRSCDFTECTKRTKMQKYHDEVVGIQKED